MKKYQYTLIVSQYYFSRHMFVVKYDSETFKDTSRAFATELMEYKRAGREGSQRCPLGDLDSKYFKLDSYRHNINDFGDIYFINSEDTDHLEYVGDKYKKDCINDLTHYDKRTNRYKNACNEIAVNHRYETVQSIVKKHFEIVA